MFAAAFFTAAAYVAPTLRVGGGQRAAVRMDGEAPAVMDSTT